jgi:hypothetical protein
MQASPVLKVGGSWETQAVKTGLRNLPLAFDRVRGAVASLFPDLADVRLFVGCPHCLEKHSHRQWKNEDRSGRSWRAFMHTNHFPKTVCVHPHAETELLMQNLIGMFFHEFGHLIADLVGVPSTQKNADGVILRYFGIKIGYEGKGRVQFVDLGARQPLRKDARLKK